MTGLIGRFERAISMALARHAEQMAVGWSGSSASRSIVSSPSIAAPGHDSSAGVGTGERAAALRLQTCMPCRVDLATHRVDARQANQHGATAGIVARQVIDIGVGGEQLGAV